MTMTTEFPTVSYNAKETAAIIRKDLRAAFPGVKFSLRISRGTGYGWMDLDWTDGPTESEVREFTDRYRHTYFDGMDDSTKYIPSRLWMVEGVPTVIRFTCHGVNGQREHSETFTAAAVEVVTPDPMRWALTSYDHYDGIADDLLIERAARRFMWTHSFPFTLTEED